MAKKKRKKRGIFTRLVLAVITVLLVWFLAFLIWFIWPDIEKLTGWNGSDSKKSPASSQENIPDEDRKKLDDILRKRR